MRKFLLLAVLSALASACPKNGSTPAPRAEPLHVKSYVASEKGVYVTSSLILGKSSAALVDAQFLNSEAERVVQMIRESGRTLDAVYITHAHPDHTFGLPVLHAAFPKARILAHPSVIAEMNATWQAKHDQWKPVFMDDLADTRVEPQPYEGNTLTLDGREIQLLGPAEGDDPHTVSVFVPDANTLITGDVSYAHTHVWLADTKPEQWKAWTRTIQKLAELDPETVISGHADPDAKETPEQLMATARYIEDFSAAVAASGSSNEVVKAMTQKYPALKMPFILKISADAAFAKR